MPTASRTAPAVLAGVLLLAACGSQSASPGDGDGRVRAETLCPSDYQRYESAPPVEPSVTASGTPTALPLPSSSEGVEGGVKITRLFAWGPESGCGSVDYSADFEVTNRETETVTYTVTIGFLSPTGGAVDNVEKTVERVGPGRTVKGTAVMAQTAMTAPEVTGAQVVKVRGVPADEASSASGPCPASGVRLYADEGDAAMGLRVVGLHLVNCGSEPYRVDGYPKLELHDEEHDTVDGVRILDGTDRISTATGGGGSPQPVVLRPGEAARAGLAWRNTTQAGDPVNVPYVRVWAKPGADPVTVVPELDLGTTGKLGVGPWKKDDTYRDPTATAPVPRP
ncbi:DUF4232 domain-containing protein [Streptomyces sp. uw30]|uniref:DUF4232 domain-containing protein n=1 Tax=Streptomyces sp. uw30 TaxID=1828179 RepID=UPI0011CE9C73|nr:DUF4232 domain-containing protein [Streptomyces sp. uw30]TXS40695.1 DUF4232 domain-containing protein [Streptomyces sp. uw30]